MSIKGYKIFNPDWTCRDFQYEVGKTYKYDGNIELCNAGFHFCQKASDCFRYYIFDSNNKVAEVEAIGHIKTDGIKSVTDEIVILRELNWHEVLDLVNTGKGCSGYNNSGNYNSGNYNSGNYNSGDWNSGNYNSGNYNSGDYNSGDYNSGNCNTGDCNTGDCNAGHWNTGDCNAGHWNTGDCNTGNRNTGDWNSGHCNTGNRNTGDWNSGYCNTGNRNTGDWNSTNYSTGFFNSVEQPLYAFNKPLNISRDTFFNNTGVQIMMRSYKNNLWIRGDDMTDEEKAEYPEYETTGGYLKVFDFKTACKMMWDNFTDYKKEAVKNIPNFDADVFKDITGIDVKEK